MPKPRKYKDFPLILQNYDEAKDTYQVLMPPTDMWGEPDPVEVTLEYDGLQQSLRDLEADDIELQALIALGKSLTDHLLPEGELRQNFVTAVQSARKNEGVRLRLMARDGRLQQIPWEYAYLQIEAGEENRNHFITLHPKISLVRHPALGAPLESVQADDRKQIDLLVVTANPDAPGLDPLCIKKENKVIREALEGFKVDDLELKWTPIHNDVTQKELDELLMKKPELFHFSGHGVFDEGDDQASLVLIEEKNARTPFYLEAGLLAKKLQAAGVRLAYLGACRSSQLVGASQWNAIAPALLAHNVPAVVAMQYMVLDEAAREFSHAFYLALAAGFSVDEAVSYGRLAVLGISGECDVQWGIPTLYLRAKDGRIFPELSKSETGAAKYLHQEVRATVKKIKRGAKVTGIKFGRDPRSGKYEYVFNFGEVSGELTIVDYQDS